MKTLLVANRGEIALRIMKTCREMGIATVAVAADADLNAPHARFADRCAKLGDGPLSDTYLNSKALIDAARRLGADAIHPGYGFLSENAAFAEMVRDAGLVFIGPKPETIALMGLKRESKAHMRAAGVPVVPGSSGENQDSQALLAEAKSIGFPVLIKASAGGGGKGMHVATDEKGFLAELDTSRREAKAAFGDDTVILEKYLVNPRHIEFQIFGDTHGEVIHLFERECSIQRRHQKIVEETPSVALTPSLREEMGRAAVCAARSVGYVNAGTVEFMLDESGAFYFLEMNTRLQVEHPVTEMICGVDLVRWQIEVARGERLPWTQDQVKSRGHAIEVRIYAEDPDNNYLPQTGSILAFGPPVSLGVRLDSGVDLGSEVSVFFDPLLAKLIVHAGDRLAACQRLRWALTEMCLHGVKTNLGLLRAIAEHHAFREGETDTGFLARHFPQPAPPSGLNDLALALSVFANAAPKRDGKPEGKVPDPWTNLNSWRAMP